MRKVLTSGQMKECDLRAIRSGTESITLMKKAAQLVADKIMGQYLPKKTLVVCGSGNNGGDGMLIAMILSEEGFDCDVWYVGEGHNMSEEAAEIYDELLESDVNLVESPSMCEYTVIVDAILGTGISFAPNGLIKEAINTINSSERPVVSVDIPSGISADNGTAPGVYIIADKTMTIQSYKRGHCFSQGIDASGKVFCVDIGVATDEYSAYDDFNPIAVGEEEIANIPRRKRDSHKGDFGRVLVVAGKKGMCGAAYFSAAAAYKSGSGIVEILTTESNRIPLQILLPEAIISSYSDTDPEIEVLRSAIERASVIVVGPGIGTDSSALKVLTTVYKYTQSPIIVDADALTLTAKYELSYPTDVPVIVTPHPGELARLTGKSIKELSEDKFGSAMKYASENDIICVSKFARTVITDGEELYVNMSGGPSLSKGGSGDILTGIIAGMLCCDLSPIKSAAIGTYIHGCAGDNTAIRLGNYSPTATDVIKSIHTVMENAGKPIFDGVYGWS